MMGENASDGYEDSECKDSRCSEEWPDLDLDFQKYGAYSNYDDRDPYSITNESEKLQALEEQQELLNSSLMALTSHFAQVQFRLRQIVDAPSNEKETLLRDLEEFAFRGIPEVHHNHARYSITSEKQLEETLNTQREKQKELIAQLKEQLEDLEKYAYETGDAELPQSIVIERQKVIIDQLKEKLNLNVDQIDKLTIDDLRNQVDRAIGQLVNPLKMKEQLVVQLKTQISDLERFIEFLQGGSPADLNFKVSDYKCNCNAHETEHKRSSCKSSRKSQYSSSTRKKTEEELRTKTLNVMKRMSALLHFFARTQFGCEEHFKKNTLKKTMKINHWGDLRAQLELAVVEVLQLISEPEVLPDSDYMSDSEGAASVQCNGKLASAVRKHLAMGIQNLMQHGLMPVGQSMSLVPFISCFPVRQSTQQETMHAWELILKYYEMKNGEEFNSRPARKLSQSFNLNIGGDTSVSIKQTLLSTIGNIILSHSQYKRSFDSHFKAFVCAGLNHKMLVPWLRLIFRFQPLIENFYQPWSYVAKTGKCTHIAFQYLHNIFLYLCLEYQNIMVSINFHLF
ncbi:unnamed protein product [Bemisia tabaci]|uniref:RUN domain-containing protein n=1 Tax=Bemisia tabaci TaxID=7038 RepID=A0A9P0AAQ4_BEMTA|nr:unnamed protein product [Bemisia tabaci]